MHIFHLIGILTTLAAAFSFINYHFLRMQLTISLMLQSLLFSVVLMVLLLLGIDTINPVRQLVSQIDFDVLLLQGLLSFLLFAGALFVKIEELLDIKWDIAIFATAGVMISTAVIVGILFFASRVFSTGLRPLYCFIF